jgi:succinate dehydrogenase/fumarate reductase-like Fe-S protein
MCACCSNRLPQLLVERRPVPFGPCSAFDCKPLITDSRDEATGERWMTLKIHLPYHNTIMNCADLPEGLNPAAAIANVKR